MMKLVLYQDSKSYWAVSSQIWNEFCYEEEINPIRFAIVECTDMWAKELMKIFEDNKELFVELIQKELDSCFNMYAN